MPINATFTVVNTAGVTASVVTQYQALAQAAVGLWSAMLAGSSTTNIRLSIVDSLPSGRAQGGNETAAFLGTVNGNNVFEPGTAYELRTGLELGQAGNDIHISIAREYLLNELFLDASPETSGDIPIDRTDGLSVLVHEIGHALGFIGYYNEAANDFFFDANTPYDTNLILRDGEIYFDGANVRDVYGDAAPLTDNNYTHYGNSIAYPGTSTDPLVGLMNGVAYYRGYRYTIGDLDLAFMADNGIGTISDDSFSVGLMRAFNGGAGSDTVDFASVGAGVTVSLATSLAQASGGAGAVTLVGIENVDGTAFPDTLRGSRVANQIAGDDGNDTLIGLDGNDTLSGGLGDDLLSGGAGNDDLIGGEGTDTLNGGLGADRLEGGAGDDVYILDSTGDAVIELGGGGVDRVIAHIDFTVGNEVEHLSLAGPARIGTGNPLDNIVRGSIGSDTLRGLGGNDGLIGGTGVDMLDGGAGNDVLTGNSGRDTLTGGTGADRFVFFDGDSSADRQFADRIVDFSHAEADKIVLRGIDADSSTVADENFAFIGSAAFGTLAGQLRVQATNAFTYVEGDVNGAVALVAADFVL